MPARIVLDPPNVLSHLNSPILLGSISNSILRENAEGLTGLK